MKLLSRKYGIFTGLIILTIILAATIDMGMKKEKDEAEVLFELSAEDSAWVKKKLSNLSLREKVAQMVMPNIAGIELNEEEEDFKKYRNYVKDLNVGGVIFFQGNIKDQALLTNKLQNLADVPLLISSDFERGLGMRLEDAVGFPHNMALGAANDTTYSYRMGKAVAQESRVIGVYHNYAPIVDVNHDANNPIINIRAFSDDPEVIARHSTAFIKGMHSEKVLTTAKHFPGHGATELDSHRELPLINLPLEAINKTDLMPFRRTIDAGVKSIMIGHLEVPALETTKGLPATLSKRIVTVLLKEKLGFEGLIVTDALNMDAVANNFTIEETAVKAVDAGNDILLFPVDAEETINAVQKAVEKGVITESRIDSSAQKILQAKKWLELDKEKLVDLNKIDTTLNKMYHWRIAEDIAEKAITLVRNDENFVPIDENKYDKIANIIISDTRDRDHEPYVFEKLVNEKLEFSKSHLITKRSRKSSFDRAYKTAQNADLIIVPLYVTVRSYEGEIKLSEKYIEFIEKLRELNKPIVFLAVGNPYLIRQIPDIKTYVCSYSGTDVSQRAVFNALFGRRDIKGELPVSIFGTPHKIGDGIKINKKYLDTDEPVSDSLYDFTLVDSLMEKGVNDSVFPGGVLLVGHRDRIAFHKAYGNYTYDTTSKGVDISTVYDLASLTKVTATTSAAMLLYDQGKLSLDDKVSKYLPEFADSGKGKVTIKNLLLHNSGLPAWKPFYKNYTKAPQVVEAIMQEKLEFEPGSNYQYSDLGMITLQKVIEKITGTTLDAYLKEQLFEKLNMKNTRFNPPAKLWTECAPTEIDKYWRMQTMQGKVHDETAYLLNGVAGHAGLFSTAGDLAKLMSVYVNNGKFGEQQIFNAHTVDEWTTEHFKKGNRAYGWGTNSEGYSSNGRKFSDESFGHTGFTGTSIWTDKKRGLFVILLTNRVHPTRENTKIIDFRPKLHNAVVEAVEYF